MIDAFRIACIGRHAGLLREIAHGVKDGSAKRADMAARLFDAALPPNCVIVPMPGHRGRADAMLDVALRVSAMSGRAVLDALACVPHESSYAQKARGEKPSPIAMRARFAVHGKIVVIDNCIASGVTAYAALDAIPTARVCAITISNWRANMKKKYIVHTHVGDYPTWATSPGKAISNIRFRLYGRTADNTTVMYWTAEEAA